MCFFVYIYVFFLALLRYNCDITCKFFIKFSFLKIYLFGCAGSLLLHAGFLYLQRAGLLCVVVCGLLIVVASLVAEPRLWAWASEVAVRRLSSCGSWA